MSSEQTAPTEKAPFEQRLESMHERYRRRRLKSELEEFAAVMETTVLQQVLAQAFFSVSIELNQKAKTVVGTAMDALQEETYGAVENKHLPNLRTHIEDEQTRVSNEIQEYRLDRLDTVRAMRRLNGRVNRVDGARLQALEQLLDNWNWRPQVYTETAKTLPERRQEAETYGDEMVDAFEQLKAELFGPYKKTDVWPIVESLLDENRLTYRNLTQDERQLLAESDLAEYVELSLS